MNVYVTVQDPQDLQGKIVGLHTILALQMLRGTDRYRPHMSKKAVTLAFLFKTAFLRMACGGGPEQLRPFK